MGGPSAKITPEASAEGIINVIDAVTIDTTGTFMQWNGESHNW